MSLAFVLSSLLQLAKLLSNWISDADLEQDDDHDKNYDLSDNDNAADADL